MYKILICSSKDQYEQTSLRARAESHLTAYKISYSLYQVVKNTEASFWVPWTTQDKLDFYGKLRIEDLRKHIELVEYTVK